jgi:hypothetical protein
MFTYLTMYMRSCLDGMTTAFPLCAIRDLSISARDSYMGNIVVSDFISAD